MKKEIIFLVVLIFSLFLLSSGISAEKYEKVDSRVANSLEKQNDVRVFVKFKEENIIEKTGLMRKIKIEGYKEKTKRNLKNKIKHDFGDMISVEINLEDLEDLKNNPDVESVEQIGVRQTYLQDSVSQINASLAYNLQYNN